MIRQLEKEDEEEDFTNLISNPPFSTVFSSSPTDLMRPNNNSNDNDEKKIIRENDRELLFEKRLDIKSGTFIYQLKSTDFITKDVPYGWDIPLTFGSQIINDDHDTFYSSTTAETTSSRSCSKLPTWSKEIRRDMINEIRYKHKKKKEKENRIFSLKEKERHLKLWKDACERGSKDGSGHVLLSGENLGYIWDDLNDFECIYSIPLISLSLVGHGLVACDHVGEKIKGLQLLNLSSNKIYSIDNSIGNLIKLCVLNLSHNNLEQLPDTLGNLQQLQVLNLAHNVLFELPSTLTQLCNLRLLNLEHNRIRQLPLNIGKMRACRQLIMNSNRLMVLPTSISELLLLEKLLLNDNQLQNLPTDICLLKSVKVLHASCNLLVSIPDNIGNLSALESLWLDFNQLSSIPHGFHGLVNLRDLKLEGNVDMVHPPIDVIQLGAESVKKWSETRLTISVRARQRHIITSLQDILDQIGTIGLKNEQGEVVHISSIYQKDVEFNGEQYFQFVETALFETFLRYIFITWAQSQNEEEDSKGCSTRSFPYEREETEKALHEYEDISGKVFIHHSKCRFHRCCCIDSDGKKKVCVPPAFGWMCERPAVMLKAHLLTERNQEQKRRMKIEADRINAKTQLAKKMAQVFLLSNEGRIAFRKAAYAELLKRLSNKNGPIDGNSGEKKLVLSRRLLWSQLYRRQLSEIEDKLKSEFIAQEIDRARDGATIDNQRISKIVDLWKGASIDRFFIAWRTYVRKTRRQMARVNNFSIIDDSLNTSNNGPINFGLCSSSRITVAPDQSSLLDALEVIDVQQERISAASRILQAKKERNRNP